MQDPSKTAPRPPKFLAVKPRAVLSRRPVELDLLFSAFDTSPVELQPELHIARVGLNVGNLSKLATELVNCIDLPIRSRRQAPMIIGQAQILMVQGVEHLPLNLEVLAFGKVKVFG
jgi:hypothetical protein